MSIFYFQIVLVVYSNLNINWFQNLKLFWMNFIGQGFGLFRWMIVLYFNTFIISNQTHSTIPHTTFHPSINNFIFPRNFQPNILTEKRTLTDFKSHTKFTTQKSPKLNNYIQKFVYLFIEQTNCHFQHQNWWFNKKIWII